MIREVSFNQLWARPQDNLRPIVDIQFFHDVADVHLHRALRHAQLVSDNLVGTSIPQHSQDFILTRREMRELARFDAGRLF